MRELSTEQEKREQEGIDEKTRELQNKLDETNDELERLRDDRVRQATMVENIVRQRDMYRVLLSQGSNVSCIFILLKPNFILHSKRNHLSNVVC